MWQIAPAERIAVRPVDRALSSGFNQPVAGAGAGAARGAQEGANAISHCSGDAAIMCLVLAPVLIGTSSAIAAARARSKEDVAAAMETLRKALDGEVPSSELAIRVTSAPARPGGPVFELAHGPDAGTEATAADGNDKPSKAGDPSTRMLDLEVLQFTLSVREGINPDSVLIVAVRGRLQNWPGSSDARETRWQYRSEEIAFFELVEDDAARLKQEIGTAYDKIAAMILAEIARATTSGGG